MPATYFGVIDLENGRGKRRWRENNVIERNVIRDRAILKEEKREAMFDQIPVTGMATCYARKSATLQKLWCLSTLLASQFVLSRMRIFCDAAPFWTAARLVFGFDTPIASSSHAIRVWSVQLFGDQRDTNQKRVTSAVLGHSSQTRAENCDSFH